MDKLYRELLSQVKRFKARAVVTVFPDLLSLANVPRGSRYALRIKGSSNVAVLVPYTEPKSKGAVASGVPTA